MPIMLTRKDGPPTPFRNAEYIPFYYFIPKSILSRCGAELNAIPRNPQELFHNRTACEFVESDLFRLLIIDATAFMVWPYMGFDEYMEIYSGYDPAWRFAHCPDYWIQELTDEGILASAGELFKGCHSELGYVPEWQIDIYLRYIVPNVMKKHRMDEIIQVAREYPCFEDFDFRKSNQKTDFIRKWYHTRTKHPIISLEEFQEAYADAHGGQEYEEPDPSLNVEETAVAQALVDQFKATLSEKDMKTIHNTKIIGIDHGYGNMKTANYCFPTGITAYDHEPLFTADMLVYGGRYYLIGEGHKEFAPDKIKDEDYYVLTLAAIAKELKAENLTEAHIVIAAGLPLTWTNGQKADFRAYLMKNAEVEFVYKKTAYHLYIDEVRIYPQGYAAIASFATTLKGVNLIADIGNGTMNTLYMINGKPQQGKMFTEKFGTYQCTLAVREAFMQKTQREINDAIIEEVLITGTANIAPADLKIIKIVAAEYVRDIFRRLREHGYDESTMTLYVTGGGGCLVKNFYKFSTDRVKFVEDICAAAKGYEYLAEAQMKAEAKG